MIRKIFLSVVLAAVGLFAAVPAASAAPTPVVGVNYGTVNITTNITIVNNGGVVIIGGGGFLPGETINITITYNAPSGLRSNRALAAAAAAESGGTAVADAQGNFSSSVNLTQPGVATITATGATSGRSVSTSVTVLGGGDSSPTGTTTAGSTAVVTYSTETVAPVAGGDGNGGGLASTGASIAGPLAVGGSALIAGLALLFFGSRLVIRRRSSPSSH